MLKFWPMLRIFSKLSNLDEINTWFRVWGNLACKLVLLSGYWVKIMIFERILQNLFSTLLSSCLRLISLLDAGHGWNIANAGLCEQGVARPAVFFYGLGKYPGQPNLRLHLDLLCILPPACWRSRSSSSLSPTVSSKSVSLSISPWIAACAGK